MVANMVSNARRLCKISKEAGLKGPFVSWEPMPEWDHCGYEIAVGILLAYRKEGRHSKDYVQCKYLKHMRSCYSNFLKSSATNVRHSLT